jgi:hypothetical protein
MVYQRFWSDVGYNLKAFLPANFQQMQAIRLGDDNFYLQLG